MPKLINIDKWCENLPEVTSPIIFSKKKYNEHSLFSEQIFGPITNYTCQCGITYGLSRKGHVCNVCGVTICNTSARRRNYAKIKLPIAVVNPIFRDLLFVIGGKYVKDIVESITNREDLIIFKKIGAKSYNIEKITEPIPHNSTIYDRVDGLKEIILDIATKKMEKNKDWNIVIDNIDSLIMKNVIVIPADLRPAGKSNNKAKYNVDELNRYYISILNKKEIINDIIVDINRNRSLYFHHYKQLQKDVDEIYNNIQKRLSKKKGLIRGNILGKRIDFSGRAVIVPEPTLELDQCQLPYIMLLELYKLDIGRKLIETGKFKLINMAISYIDECIAMKNKKLVPLVEEVIKEEYCLLNRQPTLHRLSILGFKILMTLDNVIKIHPLVCSPYNADFDGDQMAVYIPLGKEAKEEVRTKFLVTNNLANPTDTSLSCKPNQDIVMGIYLLTTGQIDEYSDLVKNENGKEINSGLILFNSILPTGFRFIDYPVGSKQLVQILTEIRNIYGNEITKNVLDEVKRLGFRFSTSYGITMSLDHMVVKESKKIVSKIFDDKKEANQMLKEYSDDNIKKILQKSFEYSYIIDSGARGSWDQVKQVVLARGFISDFNGNIHLEPIKHSLIDGLNPREFFLSCYGARKGLLDIALNTGESGYMTRKLIFTCANLELGEIEDCGCNDFLKVNVDNKNIAKGLLFRYYLDKETQSLKEITIDNYLDLVGQEIQLRSPIYCKSKQICKTCYGKLYTYLNSKYIGIIASQCLGECNTQLVLRTFHSSGIAKISKEEDLVQCDIIGDLSHIRSILHKFDDSCNCHDIVRELFDIYSTGRSIHMIHFECVVCQLMWNKNNKWRLTKDRESKEIQFHSISNVPSMESWIHGLAFSKPKYHIIKGLLDKGKYEGTFDKIIGGEKVD